MSSPVEQPARGLFIIDASNGKADISGLEREAASAVALFSRLYGPPSRPVRLRVSYSCVTCGYNFKEDIVNFCAAAGVQDFGISSPDVIHHEVFHALLCQKVPAACSPNLTEQESALHEAFADSFSHKLNPDSGFGEGFYSKKPIRPYNSAYCYSLVSGSHAKGTALASSLISEDAADGAIRAAIRKQRLALEDFPRNDACLGAGAPSFDARPEPPFTKSELNRYAIADGQVLRLRFVPNDSLLSRYPDISVEWGESSTFSISQRGLETEISVAVPGGPHEKQVARFKSGGEIFGFMPFYLRASSK